MGTIVSNMEKTRAAAVSMLSQLLAPIVRLLIELGVDFRTFSDIARHTYVQVASREYGLRGRETNTSRIALLTGINRRDVARLRTAAQLDADSDPSNPIGRVLSGWYQDPDFVDGEGRPRPLREGDELDQLLLRYGGDVPATAILKELQRVEAIELKDNIARPLARYYMPFELAPASLARYASVVADLTSTINHNLLERERYAARFEGRAINPRIRRRAYAEFRQLIDQQGEEFLERVDDWLTAHQADDEEENAIRLGVGVYLIFSSNDNETPKDSS